MTSLATYLSDLVSKAFMQQDLPAELGAVRVSDRPDLAQFQCNGAMAAAKLAKQNPRAIAGAIVEALGAHDIFTQIEIAGPGFINLSVRDEALSAHLVGLIEADQCGVPVVGSAQNVVLDYGGPNVAKAMHVGHLRSSIIGDSLRRLYDFVGYKTYADIHLGDWGLPMGQLLSQLEIEHPDWPYFQDGAADHYPSESPVTIDDLAELYPKASGACKESEARLELARAASAKLQDGHAGYRALWQHFIDVSIAAIKANYDALGVHFDLWLGESDAHASIAPMVETLKKRGVTAPSEGAIVIPVEREEDMKEMPPLILIKSNGAVMYSTTDLATLVDRQRDYQPAKVIYCVDQRQSLHFEQVFRAAYKGEIVPQDTQLVFAGFGTMNGADGKPFKTRAGGVMRLDDLIQMALDKAHARLDEVNLADEITLDERADIAHKVALAALKFADLQNNRSSDYVFDLDRMTAFEGKTGPYLLYQVVRIKSLLRKAEGQGAKASGRIVITPDNQELALQLCEIADHVELALKNHAPHILCDYAYKLAQNFSSFYSHCHILSEEDDARRAAHLTLCAATAKWLETILDLLGIDVPDRM